MTALALPRRRAAAAGAATFVVGRVIAALLTLLVVSLLVFTAIHLIPGGYEQLVAGPFQNEAARARIAEQFALGDPLPQQFVAWLGNVVRGDLSVSLASRQPVAGELLRRAVPTAQLAVMATVVAVGVGVPLGMLAALADHRPAVRDGARLLGAGGLSVPDFVLGTILVYVFSRWSLGLRVGGYVPLVTDPVANLRTMLLPAASLGVFGVALVMRTTRDAVLTTLAEPHIGAAVARGERRRSIIRHHLIRNSSLPVVTVVATYVGVLLGGAVIIEDLFSIPGIGTYIVNAIARRDYAVIQGGVLLAAAVVVTVNMLADISYAVLNPRLRKGAR